MIRNLLELAGLFLKLGAISFGGHAAHIAVMEQEIVERRKWVSPELFLDLIGVTNLIPGPNAVELAGLIGHRRAGSPGAVLAGLCFTLPGVLVTGVFAWGYVRFGELPAVEPFLLGIKPAVLALIVVAAWRLGEKAMREWQPVLIAIAVGSAALLGADEVAALLIGAVAGAALLRFTPRRPPKPKEIDKKPGQHALETEEKPGHCVPGIDAPPDAPTAMPAIIAAASAGAASATLASGVSIWKLGLFFLKVGAVMFGGGYVLVAYIEGGLVGTYGLTQQQLIDAVAIGQLTPGPLLSTATFVGYLLAGVPGAAAATVGILLPSFFFVEVANPLIPRLRRSRLASLFLDAVVAASIGLILAVAVKLAGTTMVAWQSWLIALSAAGASLRWKVSPAWLVVAGAAAGRFLM